MITDYQVLLQEIKELRCACGNSIGRRNKTGLCQSCGNIKGNKTKMAKSNKHCEICGKKLASHNDSMRCSGCRYASQRMRRREYLLKYSSLKNQAKRKTKMRGKCRLCGKGFRLETWQHGSLHWCPDCRNLEVYRNYYSNQKAIERFNREIKKGYQTSAQAILRETGRT